MYRRLKLCIFFALLFLALSIWSYLEVLTPSTQTPPKGPIEIGFGPLPDAQINQTEVIVDIPNQTINATASVKFNQTDTQPKKFVMYVLLPYHAVSISPYTMYNSMFFPHDSVTGRNDVGILSFDNLTNDRLGSTIVNASLDVNPNFPFVFFPYAPTVLRIGISIKVSDNLIAVSDNFGSKTAIFIFFGQPTSIMSDDMWVYYPIGAEPTISYPFIVQLRLPPSCYYSSSQPPLTEYFIENGDRWAMFSLTFPQENEAIYAQTLVCNLVDPRGQSLKEIWIFLTGVFVTGLFSFMIEAISEANDAWTKRDSKTQDTTSSDLDEQPRAIPKLIGIVDSSIKVKRTHVLTAYSPLVLIAVVVPVVSIFLALSFMFFPLTPAQADTLIVAMLAVVLAIGSLGANLINITEKLLAFRYYEDIVRKNKIKNPREKQILRALVSMKVKHPQFNLSTVNEAWPMLSEPELLKRLYDPSQN